jgi:hypothetical protein
MKKKLREVVDGISISEVLLVGFILMFSMGFTLSAIGISEGWPTYVSSEEKGDVNSVGVDVVVENESLLLDWNKGTEEKIIVSVNGTERIVFTEPGKMYRVDELDKKDSVTVKAVGSDGGVSRFVYRR